MSDVNHHDLARMICQSYGYPEYGRAVWDRQDITDGVHWFTKVLPDTSIVLVLPGTDISNISDVFCDLDIMPEDTDFLQMGDVHSGFDLGLPSVISEIAGHYNIATLSSPGAQLRICGHSLGAARGNLIHERMICMRFDFKYDPVLFGEPRSTERVPVDAESYLNGCDPIHGLPPYPYTGRAWYHKLSVPPPRGHRWGPLLGWHDMRLYEQGVRDA